MKYLLFTLFFVSFLYCQVHSYPHMVEQREHLLQAINKTRISIFFYGTVDMQEYQSYQLMLPSDKQLFPDLQFYFIPSDKFKLNRPNPSLSIYRQINNGQWLIYKGRFDKTEMSNWIRKNSYDPLKNLNGEDVDTFFIQSKKGFILLDFGQFNLLRTKIMLHAFCEAYRLLCGKVNIQSNALNMAIKLMRSQDQPGVSKLAFWNPESQQFQIYTKDITQIKQNQLMELYEGHAGVIPLQVQIDVAEVIAADTQVLQQQQQQL